jgi:hypothetical protein
MDVTASPGSRTRLAPVIVCLLVAFAALTIVPQAEAAFGVNSFSAAPTSPDAGAHSDFVISVGFAPGSAAGDSVKDLTIHLPPGQVADPTATPLCTVDQLNAASCPADTQVGAVSSDVEVAGVPSTVTGKIYNLTPQPGEPARFGIVLSPTPVPGVGAVIQQSQVKLRTTDYGLDSILSSIPNMTGPAATHIDSLTTTLFGTAATGKSFSRNPTSCSPATTSIDATGYDGTTATASSAYTPTNCSALDFSPTFSASIGSPGHTAIATHPPLETVVDQDLGEAGAENVQAILPKDVGADPVALQHHCRVASFLAGTCPKNTIVGSATATAPYLTAPLQGPVSIVEPAVPGLPRLGLDLQGSLHIQLFGSFVLTANGPGNAFVGLPDIPLSHFVLDFKAGDLVTTSRDLCTGPAPTFSTDFLGWNGAMQSGDVAAKVNGCGSGGNAKPKAKTAVTNASSQHPHLKLTVTDKAKIKQTKLTLAKGLAFAKGKAVKQGVKVKGGRVVKAKSRTLKATGRGTKLVEKAVKQALVRTTKIAGKKLRFTLSVTDATGKTTKLKLAAKAKP